MNAGERPDAGFGAGTDIMGALLREYLAPGDRERPEGPLSTLITEHVDPLVRKVLRRKLGAWGGRMGEEADLDDIAADVQVDLLGRLRDLKLGNGPASIDNFPSYVASSAYHAANEYLRSRYPQRHRLKNRLRYLLANTRGLDLWEGPNREWLCGKADWRERVPASPQDVERWRERRTELPLKRSQSNPGPLVAAVAEAIGAPFGLDELVAICSEVWGVTDQTVSIEAGEHAGPVVESDPEAALDRRTWLTRLWAEIRELPLPQRIALLFHIRSEEGTSALFLLPVTGIAGIRQIAEMLGMAAEELGALWNRLPLDDLTTAARLGLTRQQVINLRKSARERLARRMKSMGKGTP